MNKTILYIIIGILITFCSTTKNVNIEKEKSSNGKPITYDFADKISKEKLDFIKKNYNWSTEKYLS
ncbi:hypothetical protein [Pseudofulvibacter geojedonensis]|uniref:Uncharacterized protein n=1 Tax=Pseudofulvibacter geojedonensis TaxID=1123758 RepID=A0ABW3I2P4_9FLAO